jgi:hypothetical protein
MIALNVINAGSLSGPSCATKSYRMNTSSGTGKMAAQKDTGRFRRPVHDLTQKVRQPTEQLCHTSG